MTKQSLFRENVPKTAALKPTHTTHSLSLTCPWCGQEVPVSRKWGRNWCITNGPAYTHFKNTQGSLEEMKKFVAANQTSKNLSIDLGGGARVTLKVVPISFTAKV